MINKQAFIKQDEIIHYLKDVRKIKVMTPAREKELAKIMLNPETPPSEMVKVEREIVEGNLRFVISVAKNYQSQGMDLADLIAEGNYGLLKAIKSFDWTKGFRFISYAVWWVKQSILQCLNEHARTIRLPVNIVQELQRQKKMIGKEITELDSKLSSLPTTINYDKPINEEGDTLINLLVNEDAEMPDAIFDDECNIKTELQKLMKSLDNREKEIIERYYGLNYTPHTLQEIGEIFNLTKERVRQIKEKALRKLRNDSYSLLDYLTN
jgi:RNA polymerase primary sigma factor|tara:strand:- start:1505 stop:2305 length:801 start_codon:yes stop_codon:yes gene_type:complete